MGPFQKTIKNRLLGEIKSLVATSGLFGSPWLTWSNQRGRRVLMNPAGVSRITRAPGIRMAVLVVVCVAVSFAPAFLTLGQAFPGETTRVSVSSSGEEGNRTSEHPSISADGRFVAFISKANNIVTGDSNGTYDTFVLDRHTGQTMIVSVSSGGVLGNSASDLTSYPPSISAGGRYVAFSSSSSNLVAGDTNFLRDIFVHDRHMGTTTRVSGPSTGEQGNGTSWAPSISANGRYVAFRSDSSNLVEGDSNGQFGDDGFVHDRQTGLTTMVSVSSSGEQGNDRSGRPSISANGRYVVFTTRASNLVAGDTNNRNDIFIHDLATGRTSRVSVSSSGEQGNDTSYNASINADGRYVAFFSKATNLVAGDTNGGQDIFVHDRFTGTTNRLSISVSGEEENPVMQGSSTLYPSSISADGRFVAFGSEAIYKVVFDSNNNWNTSVFVYDRHSGNTSRVSVSSDGREGNRGNFQPIVSANGRNVTFTSSSTNLLSGSSFVLVSKQSGQCLDITGGSPALGNGVALQQYPCHGGANQQFRLTGTPASIVAVHSNKCLDVQGVSQDDGAAINQYDCHGGPNQQWSWDATALPPSSGLTTFRVAHSNKCLTIPNPGVVGDEAVQATCDGGENQQFQLQPFGLYTNGELDTNGATDVFVHERSGPVNAPQALTVTRAGSGFGTVTSQIAGIDCGSDCSEDYVSGSTVTLTALPDAGFVFTGWSGGIDWSGVGCSGNEPCTVVMTQAHTVTATFSPAIPVGFTTFSAVHSNKCLTIPNPGVVGDEAVQATCDGGDNQQFIVNFAGPDVREFVSKPSGQCLDITGAATGRVALQQYPCHGGRNQRFHVPDNIPQVLSSSISALHSGKCLDVAGASTEDGAAINQYECHGGLNQQWIWTDSGDF